MSDLAYVNFSLISWGDLEWTVILPDAGGAQSRFYGFDSIDFGEEKRERPPVYGQNRSQAPMGLPAGEYVPPNPKVRWIASASDASDKADYESYIEFLSKNAPDGRSYGNVRQQWQLYVNNPGAPILYKWTDIYCTGGNAAWERTAEGLKIERTFTCTRFSTNGKTLYDSSRE